MKYSSSHYLTEDFLSPSSPALTISSTPSLSSSISPPVQPPTATPFQILLSFSTSLLLHTKLNHLLHIPKTPVLFLCPVRSTQLKVLSNLISAKAFNFCNPHNLFPFLPHNYICNFLNSLQVLSSSMSARVITYHRRRRHGGGARE